MVQNTTWKMKDSIELVMNIHILYSTAQALFDSELHNCIYSGKE